MKKGLLVSLLVFCVISMTAQGGLFDKFKKKKNKKVEMKFLISQPRFYDIYEKYAEMFVEKYNQENDKKLEIEIESFPTSQYANILKSKVAAGDQMDLLMLHASNELPDYVKGDFIEPLNDTKLVDQLYEGSANGASINGNLYGLPLESMNWAMLYNKDLFAELGLKPANTIAELKEISDKIKKSGKTPFLVSYQEAWIPQLFLPLIVGTVDSKNDFIDKMNNEQGSFEDIKSELFDVMDVVHANGNGRAFEIGGTSGCTEFATGDYGMWIQGPWFAETILGVNPDLNFGVASLPINNDKEMSQIMQAVTTTITIAKHSENKEVAKEFLEYLLSDDVTNDFFQELKFNPVAKNHTYKVFPWVEDSMEYISKGRSYKEESIPTSVKDESGKVFQSYYAGEMNQEEVVEALDNAWATYNKVKK